MIPVLVLVILIPVLVLTSSFDSKTTKDFNRFRSKTENDARRPSNSNISTFISSSSSSSTSVPIPIPIIKALSEGSMNRVAFSVYSESISLSENYIFAPKSRNKSDRYSKSPISEPDFQKFLNERIHPKSKSESEEINAKFSDEEVEVEEDSDNTNEKLDKKELEIDNEEEIFFNMDG